VATSKTNAIRITVPDDSWATQVLPSWIRRAKMRNDGSVNVRVRFNSGTSDYITIPSGETQDFHISGEVTAHVRADTGGSDLEIVFA